MRAGMEISVASYNIHGCVGMDRRTLPARIGSVISQLDADVLGLQEVLSIEGGPAELHQANYLIGHFASEHCFVSENEKRRGGSYGNLILSRLPILRATNHDISFYGREPRGCIQADIELPDGSTLHFFNAHLGLSRRERVEQAKKLAELLSAVKGPRILVGDFNEWISGEATRILAKEMATIQVRRCYPGIFPVLQLDNIYYDRRLNLVSHTVHRTRLALLASDHIPITAKLRFS